MAGFFSSDSNYIFILLLIMVITGAIAIKYLEIKFDWGRAPLVMILGFTCLYYLHPGYFN